MLQNIYEYLSHRTPPGLTVSDTPCKRQKIFNKLEKQSILFFLVFKYIKRTKASCNYSAIKHNYSTRSWKGWESTRSNPPFLIGRFPFLLSNFIPRWRKKSRVLTLLRNYFPVVVILQCTLSNLVFGSNYSTFWKKKDDPVEVFFLHRFMKNYYKSA